MANDLSSGWTLVNAKQKRQEKKEKRRQEQAQFEQLAEAEKKRQRDALTAMSYSGLVKDKDAPASKKKQGPKVSYLGGAPPTTGTLFSAFSDLEEAKLKARQDKQLRRQKQKEQDQRQELAAAEAKRKKKKKNKKATLKQLAEKIDVAEFQARMSDLPNRFPRNYDLQLKSLAEYFEEDLFSEGTLPPAKRMEEKTFERKLEIPYCYLSDGVVDALASYFRTVPEPRLVTYCHFLLKEIIGAEKRRHTSGLGLRMLLQTICHKLPSAFSGFAEGRDFVSKYRSATAKTYATGSSKGTTALPAETPVLRPDYFATLVWVLGQSIKGHPNLALTLWYKYLLPMLCIAAPESVKAMVLEFFDLLVQRKQALKKHPADDPASINALEHLMLLRAAMNKDEFNNGRLGEIYAFVEKHTLWKDNASPRHYFPILLRYAGSAPRFLREEALEKLALCLTKDPECHQVWQNVYPHHIAQSSNLVLYIYENWKRFSSKKLAGQQQQQQKPKAKQQISIDALQMKKCLSVFLDINQRIEKGTYTMRVKAKGSASGTKMMPVDQRDLEVCNATCQRLKSRLAEELPAKHKRGSGGRGKAARAAKAASERRGTVASLFKWLVLLLLALSAALAAAYVYKRCASVVGPESPACAEGWCARVYPPCSPGGTWRSVLGQWGLKV